MLQKESRGNGQPISPLAGEMSGRTEGGNVGGKLKSLVSFFAAALLSLFLAPSAHALTLSPRKTSSSPIQPFCRARTVARSPWSITTKQRDINKRDEVPERRVRAKYVSLGVRRQQQDLTLRTAAGDIRHVAVGKTAGASLIVIYLHGQGGSRKQGVDDFTFGGNFNRIKNLAANNGGLYLSPDFSDFGGKGAGEVAALIAHYAEKSPGAPVFVACGSMGGGLCWELAKSGDVAGRLGGLLLLGSHWDDGFFGSAAFKRKVPVFFGQGSKRPGVSGGKAGSLFSRDPCKISGLPGTLRALRDRHSWHADPHDRLA